MNFPGLLPVAPAVPVVVTGVPPVAPDDVLVTVPVAGPTGPPVNFPGSLVEVPVVPVLPAVVPVTVLVVPVVLAPPVVPVDVPVDVPVAPHQCHWMYRLSCR